MEAIKIWSHILHEKELQQIIGVVNYYHDTWARRSHTLAPLTKITSNKVKFKWTKTEQDTFDEIKGIVDRDT